MCKRSSAPAPSGAPPHSIPSLRIFLAENGYRTVGMDDLVAYLGGATLDERAVVLTFDDARSSFWRFGYPLLERHGMKGVLFAIAGATTDAARCRPNLFAVWDGTIVHALDPDDSTLCTWCELAEMHASGVVEVESHSRKVARRLRGGRGCTGG